MRRTFKFCQIWQTLPRRASLRVRMIRCWLFIIAVCYGWWLRFMRWWITRQALGKLSPMRVRSKRRRRRSWKQTWRRQRRQRIRKNRMLILVLVVVKSPASRIYIDWWPALVVGNYCKLLFLMQGTRLLRDFISDTNAHINCYNDLFDELLHTCHSDNAIITPS